MPPDRGGRQCLKSRRALSKLLLVRRGPLAGLHDRCTTQGLIHRSIHRPRARCPGCHVAARGARIAPWHAGDGRRNATATTGGACVAQLVAAQSRPHAWPRAPSASIDEHARRCLSDTRARLRFPRCGKPRTARARPSPRRRAAHGMRAELGEWLRRGRSAQSTASVRAAWRGAARAVLPIGSKHRSRALPAARHRSQPWGGASPLDVALQL